MIDMLKMPEGADLVTTTCYVTGPKQDRDALIELMVREDGNGVQHFDFNRIIPMPAELERTNPGDFVVAGLAIKARENVPNAAGALKVALGRFGFSDPLQDMLKAGWGIDAGVTTIEELIPYLQNNVHMGARMQSEAGEALAAYRATGHINWLTWSFDNWGAGWNANQFELLYHGPGSRVLRFRFVTVDFPRPVFHALVQRLPNLRFVCNWKTEFDTKGEEQFGVTERGMFSHKKADDQACASIRSVPDSILVVDLDRERDRRLGRPWSAPS
jgi:hypothetical protein